MSPEQVSPNQPQMATVHGSDRAPPRRAKGFGCATIFWIFFALLGLMMIVAFFVGGSLGSDPKVLERHFSHQAGAKDKVVILSVEGTILEGQGFVKRQIDQATRDPNVKAVVLRVNSPGGTVSGSDYILHHLRKLAEEKKIPIIVSMGGIAASGGYYVSMAVGTTPDTIFAEPTTWTGSIGVIIPHYNIAGLMKEYGVEQDSVVSHRLKGMGTITRPMTDEERKIFQALVDDSFEGFKEVVRSGRPRFQKDPGALNKLATGQVYTAKQAKDVGLVDRIGFLEDAVERAIELADLDPEKTDVVEYRREFSLYEMLMAQEANKQGFDLAGMLDLAAPRAYYLWTTVPPLLSAKP